MAISTVIRVECTECTGSTNHEVLATEIINGETDDGDIQWYEKYQIIRCRGCDTISFRKTFESSEDYDPYTGDAIETETLYPHRSHERTPISGYEAFPGRTRQIYFEVLKALNSGTPILTAIGLRALIESICLEQNTPSGNLAGGIDDLVKLGLLSKQQAAFLHAHRFMGNDAAHEIKAPQPQELVAALDIAETLLKTIYILPGIAATIGRSRKPTNSSPP